MSKQKTGLREAQNLRRNITLNKWLQICKLREGKSLAKIIEEISAKCNVSEFTAKNWFYDQAKRIPKCYKKTILKSCNFPKEPTEADLALCSKLEEINATKQKGRISNQKKQRILDNAKNEYEMKKREEVFDEVFDEVVKEEMYRSAILDDFTKLPLIKKFILATDFEIHNKIPLLAWEFIKEYSSLNQKRRNIMLISVKEDAQNIRQTIFSPEEEQNLLLFQEMSKRKFSDLQKRAETVDEDYLATLFAKKLSDLTIPAPLYRDDLDLYSDIEPDEWEILVYFIQSGVMYRPFDWQDLSKKQQDFFNNIDLIERFSMGLDEKEV